MRVLFSTVAVVFAIRALAQGGPPMLTDDPGTPPKGKWELNVAFTYERTHDRFEYGLPLIDLNYGERDNLQLKVEAPWLMAREAGASTHDAGPVLAGVKWRFQEEANGRPAISIFPQVESAILRRSIDEGLAEPGTGLLLPVEVQWHRGKFGFNGDAGLFFRAGEGPQWLGGMAVSFESQANSEFLAELHFEGSFSENELDCIGQLGYRRDLSPSATLLAAVGRSLLTNGVPPTRLTTYFGVQFRF